MVASAAGSSAARGPPAFAMSSLPPAPPPITVGGVGEQRRRGHATADRGLRARRDEDRLPAAVAVADDHRGGSFLQPVANLDRELPELPRVQRRDVAHDERETVDVRGLRREVVDHRRAVAGPELPELVAQSLVLLDHPARAIDRGVRVFRVEGTDQIAEQRPLDVDLAERVGADERLDPPHPGADRALAQQPDHGDPARAVDVVPPHSSRE